MNRTNPCNAQGTYVEVDPKYNLPTYYGSRFSLQYIKPTPELYARHKLLVLKNTYITNGPGIQIFKKNARMPYRLDVDSVQYKNTIFRIPCRFQKFIDLIKILLNEGKSIQNILNYLATTYNIENIVLDKSTYQLKTVRTYSFVNVDSPKNNENTVNSSAPYKIGESLDGVNILPILNNLNSQRLFFTPQYATKIYISKNEGVNNYTNIFNDLLPGGSASFFGGLLLKNFVQNSDDFSLLTVIVPQFTNYYKTFVYIVDSTKYNIPNLTGLICIPIQIYPLLMLFKAYPVNMPFTFNFNDIPEFIDDNNDVPIVPCKYFPAYSNNDALAIAIIDNN